MEFQYLYKISLSEKKNITLYHFNNRKVFFPYGAIVKANFYEIKIFIIALTVFTPLTVFFFFSFIPAIKF